MKKQARQCSGIAGFRAAKWRCGQPACSGCGLLLFNSGFMFFFGIAAANSLII